MNKKIQIVLLLSLLLFGCSKKDDGYMFKKEFESLNDSSEIQVEMAKSDKIKYMGKEEIVDALTKGTHVVYLGWPSCPVCRMTIPVLVDTLDSYSGINLYYYSIEQIRDNAQKDIDSEDGKLYQEIVGVISRSDNDISNFPLLDNGEIKLPAHGIYFVKDGEIVAIHIGSVESHIDDYQPLTTLEKEELEGIFKNYLDILTTKSPIGCSGC